MQEFASTHFSEFLATGSPEALAAAFDVTAPGLLSEARRMRPRELDALDLVQETWLTALEHRSTFKPSAELMPWLVTILRNKARRSFRRRLRFEALESATLPEQQQPIHQAQHAEGVQALRKAIDGLPRVYRDVVHLYADRGLAPKEIAQKLDRPQATVRTQLMRGLDFLRAALPPGLAIVALASASLAAVKHRVLAQAKGSAIGSPDRLASGAGAGTIWAAVLGLAGAILLWLSWRSTPVVDAAPDLATAASQRGDVAAEAPVVDVTSENVAAVESNTRLPVTTAYGALHATLRWQDTGKPAANVSVRIKGYVPGVPVLQASFSLPTVTTDQDGVARMDQVTPGLVLILFDDANAGSMSFPVTAGECATHEFFVPRRATIEGRVVDENGAPIADTAVWVSSVMSIGAPGYVAGTTDRDGRFTVPALDSNWTLWAIAPGFAVSDLFRPPRAGDHFHLDIALHRQYGTVVGSVFARDGRRPAAQARVGLIARTSAGTGPPSRYDVADVAGRFGFAGVAPGDYVLAATADDLAGHHVDCCVTAGEATRADVELPRGVTIVGSIATSLPVESLSLYSGTKGPGHFWKADPLLHVFARPAADGTFRMARVRPGAGHTVLTFVHNQPTILASRIWDLGDGATYTWEVRLPDFAPVRGTVRLASGEPVPGISISTVPEHHLDRSQLYARTGHTDSTGTFEFKVQPTLPHIVMVDDWKTGRGIAPIAVRRVEPGGTSADIVLPELPMSNSWITGRCTATPRLAGTPGTLRLWRDGCARYHDTTVGLDGSVFRLGPVPTATYHVAILPGDTALPPMYYGVVDVASQSTKDMGEVLLSEAGTLRLRLRTVNGDAPRHHTLELRPATADVAQTTLRLTPDTAHAGDLLAQPLFAGDYRLRLVGENYVVDERLVHVDAQRETLLEGTLTNGQACAITVRFADREHHVAQTNDHYLRLSIDGAGLQGWYREVRLPADGEVVYRSGLAPGRYRVQVHAVTGQRAALDLDIGAVAPENRSFEMLLR